jgi:hypothetical protein
MYPDWRTGQFDRPEDAAYLFGFYLIMYCREEAIATLPADASPEVRAAVEQAVDTALHNVCDLLEGFWQLNAGAGHRISLALGVQVRDGQNQLVESVEISPAQLDLPIGYWKWAREHEFR